VSARDRARSAGLLIQDAVASLLLRPGHTVGMMSGITLGVASALAAVVIADTQQAQVDRQFDLQRSTHAIVKAQVSTDEGFAAGQIEHVARLEPVLAVGEFSVWIDTAEVARSPGTPTSTAPVIVADPGGLAATGTALTNGTDPGLLDADNPLPVAWLGERLAADLGVAPATGGTVADAQITLNGRPLSVAGVVSNSDGFGYVDNAVVVSRPTALTALGGEASNVRLIAHVRPGAAGAVARHMLDTADPLGALSLIDVTPPDGERLVGRVGADLRAIGAALGLFIGLVGMIAIANTLMMSVHQRRRELGLRSAIGWSRRRIGLLILTESGAAGLAAGLIGSGLGLLAAAAWCWSHGWTLVMEPALPYLVTAAGVLASLLGGAIPAARAASSSPMEAMRS
jgi:putative ABC transport system permease protein